MKNQVIDPVTGFVMPTLWLERSKDPDVLSKIQSGCWVLLSDGTLLKRGFTTGTIAAAACKGAAMTLSKIDGEPSLDEVDLLTPAGIRVLVPVNARAGTCVAVKGKSDHHSDATAGVVMIASARASEKTELIPGAGIGRIKGRGLSSHPGKAAISQSARQEIISAIDEGLEASGISGARVELSVPRGSLIAEKTLNPRMGVIGGISILGSTGFVEPWNCHLGEDRAMEIIGKRRIVVTTGRTGLRFSRLLFPDHEAVLIGGQLERLKFEDGQESILCGLPALILRWGMPGILEGTGYGTIAEMVEMEPNHPKIDMALLAVRKRLPNTRIVLILRDGRVLWDVVP